MCVCMCVLRKMRFMDYVHISIGPFHVQYNWSNALHIFGNIDGHDLICYCGIMYSSHLYLYVNIFHNSFVGFSFKTQHRYKHTYIHVRMHT